MVVNRPPPSTRGFAGRLTVSDMKRRKRSQTLPPRAAGRLARAVLVGLGNIGSHAADLIARLQIDELVLIDQGTFESKNVIGQAIERRSAIGKRKVDVVAERLHRINPQLAIRAVHSKLQNVPVGLLRCDVMVCALDSRDSRAYANQACLWLGIPTLIDSGVEPTQLLARVNVHRFGSGSSCLQCGWSDADYNLLEARNPCQSEDFAPSTNSPAALGAFAASLAVVELKKVIDGDFDHPAAGKQITVCGLNHSMFATTIGRNRECRCDHEPWHIVPFAKEPSRITLRDMIGRDEWLSVPGKTFIRALVCRKCGTRRKLLRLEGRLTPRHVTCSRCGAGMVAPGFDQLDSLGVDSLGADSPQLNRPLSALGIADGDVIRVHGAGGDRHFQITTRRVRAGGEVLHA